MFIPRFAPVRGSAPHLLPRDSAPRVPVSVGLPSPFLNLIYLFPFQHLMSERLRSLGIMGEPRVPLLNPSETIVLNLIYLFVLRIAPVRGSPTHLLPRDSPPGVPVSVGLPSPARKLWGIRGLAVLQGILCQAAVSLLDSQSGLFLFRFI